MKGSWGPHWAAVALLLLVAQSTWNARSAARPAGPLGVLDAGGINLRDSDGAIRARLGMAPDGSPGLAFFDKSGNKRIEVGFGQGGNPTVSLADPSGAERLALIATAAGSAHILGTGPKGREAYELSVLADGTVQQMFLDQGGDERLRFLVRPRGRADICLCSANGLATYQLSAAADGDVSQCLFDQNKVARIIVGLGREGNLIAFNGPDQKTRLSTGLLPDGTAFQSMRDKEGTRRSMVCVSESGLAREALFGPRGKPRVKLTCAEDGTPSVDLLHTDGIPSAGASLDTDGVPHYVLRNWHPGRGAQFTFGEGVQGAGTARNMAALE